jgi:hypothetical protein
MKNTSFSGSSAFLVMAILVVLGAGNALAERAKVQVSDMNTDQDTTITVKKGPIRPVEELPEFEIVSGEQDIEGDPAANTGEARTAWKGACAEWKKEVKELNKDNQILAYSCNSPTATLLDNGQRQMRSTGHYKLKVRIRSASTNR